MKRITALLFLSLFGVSAYGGGCATPKTAFDQIYCAGNLFSQVDHELNTSYQSLRGRLNPAEKDLLKKGQLAWLKQRNDLCSKGDETGFYVNLSCANGMTSARLEFLKARERECASTGCMDAKLSQF